MLGTIAALRPCAGLRQPATTFQSLTDKATKRVACLQASSQSGEDRSRGPDTGDDLELPRPKPLGLRLAAPRCAARQQPERPLPLATLLAGAACCTAAHLRDDEHLQTKAAFL